MLFESPTASVPRERVIADIKRAAPSWATLGLLIAETGRGITALVQGGTYTPAPGDYLIDLDTASRIVVVHCNVLFRRALSGAVAALPQEYNANAEYDVQGDLVVFTITLR